MSMKNQYKKKKKLDTIWQMYVHKQIHLMSEQFKIRNLALYYSMLLLCTAMQAYRSDIKTSYFK